MFSHIKTSSLINDIFDSYLEWLEIFASRQLWTISESIKQEAKRSDIYIKYAAMKTLKFKF